MSFLLDTCVLSELAKPETDAGVVQWLGELEKGIAKLPSSARRRKMEKWVR